MTFSPHPASRLFVYGVVGFVGQQPWILNSTIRENVVLDRVFEQQKFDRVIRLAGLQDDFRTFDKGDLQ